MRPPTTSTGTQPNQPPTTNAPPSSSSSPTENAPSSQQPMIFQEFFRNPLEFFGLTTLYDSNHVQWIGGPTIASTRNPHPSSRSDRNNRELTGNRNRSDDDDDDDDKSHRSFNDTDMHYTNSMYREGMHVIPAEAAPSQTNAIGVQPFDAVFPPDGEHQVYAEDER